MLSALRLKPPTRRIERMRATLCVLLIGPPRRQTIGALCGSVKDDSAPAGCSICERLRPCRAEAGFSARGKNSAPNPEAFDMNVRTATLSVLLAGLAGAGVVMLAQGAMKPGHERVPPYREPSPYMSAAEIQAGLNKLDPKLVASRTGGAIDFAKDKAVGVARRRMKGPQYAITHTREVEYMIVIKGTATLVTGGQLIPPTIDSDPYPNP